MVIPTRYGKQQENMLNLAYKILNWQQYSKYCYSISMNYVSVEDKIEMTLICVV